MGTLDERLLTIGPNLCSEVGNRALQSLKSVLIKKCAESGGTLTADQIASIVEECRRSTKTFALYNEAYGLCSRLSAKGKLKPVDDIHLVAEVMLGRFEKAVNVAIGKNLRISERYLIEKMSYAFCSGLAQIVKGKNEEAWLHVVEAIKRINVKDGREFRSKSAELGHLVATLIVDNINETCADDKIIKSIQRYIDGMFSNAGARGIVITEEILRDFRLEAISTR